MKTKRGFTLLELLATLTILAIVGAIVVPSYLSSQKKARTDAAISRAAVLDIAKANYLQNKGTDAWDTWDTIETTYAADPDGMNNAKYQELKTFLASSAEPLLGVGGTSAGPNEYTPRGFRYELNGLTDPTTVIDLDGGAVVAGVNVANAVKVKIQRTTFESDGSTPSTEMGGVVSGSGIYPVGSTATLIAYPRLGFEFTQWLEGSTSLGTANQVVVGPFASAGTSNYEARFRTLPPGTYNLITTVNPTGGGSIGISPNKSSYNSGETVTLTATPASGYTFDRWFGTGVSSTSNPLVVTMDQNRQIYANFIPPSYNIVMSNPAILNAGVSVPSGGTTNKVVQGSSISISATPNIGYDFVQWQGLPSGSTNTLASQIVTVNQNLTLTPVYAAAATYNLNVNVTPAGYGTAIIGTGNSTSANLYKNQSTNISAFPGSGRLFDRWILAAGNGTLNDLASVTTTFTMDANPTAVNTVVAQFKDNQLASEVITIPPGKSYIKTTAEPSAVGITTPNGLFDPAVQVDLTAQVNESFPNYRFVRWVKKPDTNTTISVNPTVTVTSPPEGVLDEYVAYFEIGVNKFLNDIRTTPYKPYNTVVSPGRDKLYSAVGLDGIIVQDINNTNPANIINICQLKYPTNVTCMNADSSILLGSTAPGTGIRIFIPPAYPYYDTAASTNATNPATTGANSIIFPARDVAWALPLNAFGGSDTFYAVSSTQVTQFNHKTATATEKDHWKQEFTYTNGAGMTSKSLAVTSNGNVYVLYQNSLGQHSIWNFNKTNVSLAPTQVLTFAAGETYNTMRVRPSDDRIHVIRGGAGYTTTNEIAVVTVNGAAAATLNYKYSYTQAGTGDPRYIVFGKDGPSNEDILIVSGPTRTVSLRIPNAAVTFNGAINTATGPYLTYGTGGEVKYGFSLAMARNPLSNEILSLPGPNANSLGNYGYCLRYPLDQSTSGSTYGIAGPFKRCMYDARGLAFDQTGNYLYVTDRSQTNFSSSHAVAFDMSSPDGTFVGGTFSNAGGILSSAKIGGIATDNVNSSSFSGKGGPGNFYRLYVAAENPVSGSTTGAYQYLQKPSGFPEFFTSATLNTVDWTPANVYVAPQVQRLWAAEFGGSQVAAFDLSTNTYPRITAFTLEGGTGAVGIATPADGNELIVSFGGTGVTPKIGVYDNQTGREKRELIFPYTGTTSLHGITYDDEDSFIYVSDPGDGRILKFGP